MNALGATRVSTLLSRNLSILCEREASRRSRSSSSRFLEKTFRKFKQKNLALQFENVVISDVFLINLIFKCSNATMT